MDGGAWWAAVCGVAQSRTQLKLLSSSSSSVLVEINLSSLIPGVPQNTWFLVSSGINEDAGRQSQSCLMTMQVWVL